MQNVLLASLFAIAALATPMPTPEAASDISLEARQDPHSTIKVCKDINGGGDCLNWSQKSHCWNMQGGKIGGYNNQISSAYPATPNILWHLWENFDCTGAKISVLRPGVDNFAQAGFNDRASSFSWQAV